MFPRSISLPAQLMIVLVGLVVGTTSVLTLVAYRSSLESLEADARRAARTSAEEHGEALVRLLASRQQRAEGFLSAAESLCGEPRGDGRFGWSIDCVRTLLHEYLETERARGVIFTSGGRVIVRSGELVPDVEPAPGALAHLYWRDGMPSYVQRAARGSARLVAEFDNREVAEFFQDRSGLGAAGELFLADAKGRFVTQPRYVPEAQAGGVVAEPISACGSAGRETIGLDYRGVETIHGFRPMPELGGGCVDAHVAYAEALAPAEQMRAELIARGAAFALIGALLSLLAAHWISAPVRRLVLAAAALQQGEFKRSIPLAGPTEVRALGRAFSTMADALARLVSREQAARLQAEQASRSKDEFIATVSHELRTPLTAILGWARLLREGHFDAQGMARAVAAIERSAESQRRLVDDLLDVSRIVHGRLQFARDVVVLSTAIDAALEAASPHAAEKGVAIEREPGEPRLAVFGDAERLQQVVGNLVSNAVKFTPPGGRVRIEVRQRGRKAELVVSDSGIGIPPGFLPHVFDWFRQADSAPTRTHSGLGLGLGLVRQIVELHGGDVRAESRGQDTGATFTVSLPLHEPTTMGIPREPILTAVAPTTAPIGDLTNVRVLVVDDDPGTVDAVRAILEHAGASVETAMSAAEARHDVVAWRPHVMVSDIAMPLEDGCALIRSLRRSDLQLPAIALTAYARREDAERALAAGFQVHLAKPVDPAHLVDMVATLAASDRPH